MTASRPPDVDALARRLPRREPPPERSAALRHALLDAAGAPRAQQTRAPAGRWVIGTGVAVAAAACVVLALRGIAPPHRDAHVAAAPTVAATAGSPSPGLVAHDADPAHPPGARLAAPAAPRAAGDQLPDGRSAIRAMRPLQLARGDTSITAPPGAQFDVDVQGDRVRLVTVRSGWVVVADAHSAATVIVERETWFPTEPPASPSGSTDTPPTGSPDTARPTAPSGTTATASPGIASPGIARSGTSSIAPPAIARRGTASPGTASVAAAGTASVASPGTAPSATTSPGTSPPGSGSGSRPSTASPRPAPSTVASRSPEPAPPAPTPPAANPTGQAAAAEQAFHDGLRALLTGNARDATGPLDRACGVSSTSQDDICYWAAIAWLRAGDRPQARRALTDVLAHYPGSTHAGEASVALGWLLLDAGDRAAARARFAAAVNDRMPDVRAEAAHGLAAAQ